MIESAIRFVYLSLSIASVYILVAIGFSIAYGSLKFVNMAHGALYLLGAYIGLFIAFEPTVGGTLGNYSPIGLALGFTAAIVLVPIILFGIGVVMERLIAKPFYERDMLDQLLVTFGILIIIQELVAVLVGRGGLSYARPDWATGAVSVSGIVSASRWRLIVIALTALFLILLYAFYKYTDFGLAVRAGTEDAEMVEMLGIKISRPFALIFAIGAGYAGLAGILGGSIFTVQPEIGLDILIPALLVVVMGGVGSITGTILAGLLVGATFTATASVYPEMATASIFLLAIIVLSIKPSGLFGTDEVVA
ncbi:branched-chain amino acid ABC transporter permease [Natrarchaeobius halalkaliphilus]|uniref:Branched-chain amino acid ABC transporter permease n=1 Tax=Natrarchaeobius halalkaliphilus TaxID=1679091 RepID=A0A3N6M0K3_9EURY|nr:branched-chain amino acid ABC transporter permease [Natrarchaeobius halalkaliphilus]RQG88094.1 branched-chain amino acid ABC transporter permease [Natrarchaeobius halalkaliphilus]